VQDRPAAETSRKLSPAFPISDPKTGFLCASILSTPGGFGTPLNL
jgi:hypothetical protein